MTDTKYVRIVLDKKNKTQRLVFTGANDCDATVNYKLAKRGIAFTNYKWIGRDYSHKTFDDYKAQTYAYAKKYTWAENVDISED